MKSRRFDRLFRLRPLFHTAMFLRKVLFTIVYIALTFGGSLFGAAGTFDWWRAWVLVGGIVAATLVIMFGVLRHRPALFKERMKGIFQKGQPWIDRLVILLFILSFGGMLIFTAHDVFDYHLLPKPALVISSLGLALVAAAYWFVALAFEANDFAVPVVKHQKERQHVVVDTGPYGVVRHPMYVGVILMLCGHPAVARIVRGHAGRTRPDRHADAANPGRRAIPAPRTPGLRGLYRARPLSAGAVRLVKRAARRRLRRELACA